MLTLEQLRWGLAFSLQYVRASENLLEQSIDLLDAGWLRDYYIIHLREERNHATWLEEDLDGFNIPRQPLAVCMAGSAYYMLNHAHPSAILGYMLALEHPVPISMIAELEEAYGKKLLRTARHHAEVDGGHESDILTHIEKCPADQKPAISELYRWTKDYLRQAEQIIQGM